MRAPVNPIFKIPFLLVVLLLFSGCSKNDDNPSEPLNQDSSTPPPSEINIQRVPCENGLAGIYPCSGLDLMAQIDLRSFNAQSANDIWGWADPDTGIEYALLGLDNGTAFVSLEDPETPVFIGKLPSNTGSSSWRDIKVYQNYAYVVSEAAGHGMQVFDLTQLRGQGGTPQTFSATTVYTEFGNAHNIVINEQSGFAVAVGSSTFSGGAHFIDLSDPANPVPAGGYSNNGYTHDAQVVTYQGPDTDYTGREILIAANENQVVLVNITDKAQPQLISTLSYGNLGYTHQGWFTEDQRYFILGDELDEIQFGFNSRSLVFDFSDLDAPGLHFSYSGPTTAIDHNGYIRNNRFYLANYTAGVRILDISQINSRIMEEERYFDTHPSTNAPSFNGVWSIYPYLESANILVSDINAGLFIVRESSGNANN